MSRHTHVSRRAFLCAAGAAWIATAAAASDDIRTGQFQMQFDERHPASDKEEIARKVTEERLPRDAEDYQIEDESYVVYVPPTYSHDTPHALVVWVNAGDNGGPPGNWWPVMDRHDVIWVGANNSGNNQSWLARRIPLAFDGLHNMRQRYHIDPNRIYVAGYSGGGRVASTVSMHYPDLFSGAMYVNGVNFWERMKSEPGLHWRAGMRQPSSADRNLARDRGRYVLLTGDNDFNRHQTHSYYEQGYRRALEHVLYIQVPDGGHGVPGPQWFEKAIEFLDGNITDLSRTRTAELYPGPAFVPPDAVMVPGSDYPVRTWTSVTGQTVDAAFSGLRLGMVTLVNADDHSFTIHLEELLPRDQDYVRSVSPGN